MIEIIPAIMPGSFEDLEDKLSLVAHYVKTVQLDIMDGKFVKSRSWPYYSSDRASFQDLLTENEGLPYWDVIDFEIDLMVANPEEVIDDWITAGASRLIVHVESTKHIPKIIEKLHQRFAYEGASKKEAGIELGLALNPSTPTDAVLPYLEDVHFIQFMGIDTIGLQGQPFDDRVIDKIRDFHSAHPEMVISIDGGVTLDNAKALVEAGAKHLISGSAIFESGAVSDTIEQFRNLVL